MHTQKKKKKSDELDVKDKHELHELHANNQKDPQIKHEKSAKASSKDLQISCWLVTPQQPAAALLP